MCFIWQYNNKLPINSIFLICLFLFVCFQVTFPKYFQAVLNKACFRSSALLRLISPCVFFSRRLHNHLGSRRYHSLPSSYEYDGYIVSPSAVLSETICCSWQTRINTFPRYFLFLESQASGSPAAGPAEEQTSLEERGKKVVEREGKRQKRWAAKDKREAERAEVSLNWESITEARVGAAPLCLP